MSASPNRTWCRQMAETGDGDYIIMSPNFSSVAAKNIGKVTTTYLKVERLAGNFAIAWRWLDGTLQYWDLVPSRATDIELNGHMWFGQYLTDAANNEGNAGDLILRLTGTGSALVWANGLLVPARHT